VNPTETVRVTIKGKHQLSRLKAATGIKNWNTLCRWALCISLKEPTRPPELSEPEWSNVEMSWKIFGGHLSEVYDLVLKNRCMKDSVSLEPSVLREEFHRHLHRGLGYLSTTNATTSIQDLVQRAG
jgi:DNA sulfur modification protein DndE